MGPYKKCKSKTLYEVYILWWRSNTESVIKGEIAETTQAGMKGYKCNDEVIFTQGTTVDISAYLSECECKGYT